MNIVLSEINPIELEFGGVANFTDPKSGLKEAGPFDMRFGQAQLKEVKVGIVGPTEMVAKANLWLQRCQGFIPTTMKNFIQYPDFEGFGYIFRSAINTNSLWVHEIPDNHLCKALEINDETERFEEVLNLYIEGITRISNRESNKPDVIICAVPNSVIEACHHIENKYSNSDRNSLKSKFSSHRLTNQLSLFQEEVEETFEDLLYRDFRRALKSRAIIARIPIQIGTNSLFLDSKDKQDGATRAWNFSVALYYKAGGIPWRIKNDSVETCFVGITFHHLRTNQRSVVKSCLAQAFSSDGEGFALRGGDIPFNSKNDKTVHLSEQQAYELGVRIVDEYTFRTGMNPKRVVLHKTSIFNSDEEYGFRAALSSVPIVELINLQPTSFRLLKHSNYPVNRGTLCAVNSNQFYLFTTGYIKELGTYPGPHIPRPIEIRGCDSENIVTAAKDILGLARMNWNNASITSGEPVTLFFSRQVGGILSELNVKNIFDIPTSFRYYI